ncbi:MAG: PAS domain S-box protein [Desulfomonilaceae bacterium]
MIKKDIKALDWNLKTGRAVWSDWTIRMMGYEVDELDTHVRTWKRAVHPDDWEKVSEVLNGHLSGRLPFFEIEYRMRPKSGNWKWFYSRGKVVEYDKEGKPQRITGTMLDITERRQAEEELRKSEQKYRRLVENAYDIVYTTDPNGCFTFVNPACLQHIRYSLEELIGRNYVEFIPEEYREPIGRFYGRQFVKKIPDTYYEFPFMTKNGETRWYGQKTQLLMEKDSIVGFQSIARDITERRQAEQEKQALQAQLFQSQKMEALGTLVGGIAHDFNNMLQVILGYSQLLLEDKKKDDLGCKDLQTIIQAGKGGADLVNKLLAFGQQAATFPVNLDLNHQIRELIPLISRTLPQVVKIDIDLTHGPVMIHADSKQIDQVVMNLAINASEAMPNGGRVKIGTTTVTLNDEYCGFHSGVKPGKYVMLSLSDTGLGMDKEMLAKIFEPFFSTKQRGSTRGTGLGLSVVQGIVEKHRGHVICESEPGKGSEFRIYFPAIESGSTTQKETFSSTQSAGTETILVVEDVPPVAELAQRILANAGYSVITANNGREALEIYQTRRGQISLVILDLIMPEMSGKDCLMELVKIDPSVKVLIASGFSPSDELHKEIDPLVKGFMQKPFGMTQLLDAVRSIFPDV